MAIPIFISDRNAEEYYRSKEIAQQLSQMNCASQLIGSKYGQQGMASGLSQQPQEAIQHGQVNNNDILLLLED